MINYKKSLLSLATILAIGSTSASADYIPLSKNGDNNKAWVLFGVNGFVSEGSSTSSSTVAGEFSITASELNSATDNSSSDTPDNIYGGDDVTGLSADQFKFSDKIDGVLVEGSLGKVKSLSNKYLEVRVDLSNVKYKERDPERTIYVSVGGGSPIFALKYKASLEGLTAQFSTMEDLSNVYTFTIKSEYTYNNPAPAALVTASTAGADATGTYLSDLSDIVDYNLTNNPASLSKFKKATHQDTADNNPGKNLRVYSYDATNLLWELYDSRNTPTANDFESLEKAKAYWARIDDNNTNERAGLVLGSSTLTPTDYTNAQLTDGWNLIAFDAVKSDLRVSTTGMIIKLNTDGGIVIEDASKKHSVSIGGLLTADIVASCLTINQAIKEAEINGTMPATLNLKAFPTTDKNLALISNKRFVLKEIAADDITSATTLTGGELFNATTLVSEATPDDFVSTGLQSKYGEYAVIIKPILGANTAANDSVGTFQIVNTDGENLVNLDTDTNATAAMNATVTTVAAITDVNASAINLDYGTDSDHMLIASTKPFYVRDHTFTRVFDFKTENDTNGTIKVFSNGTGDKEIDVDINGTIADVNTSINNNIPGVISDYASVGSKTELYIMVNTVGGNEFYVTEGAGADKLTDKKSTAKLAQGAVKGVYSLDYLAKRSLSNTIVFDLDITGSNLSDDVDAIGFTINGEANTTAFKISPIAGTSDDLNASVASDVIKTFDLVTKNLKEELANKFIVASVEHNCTGDADSSVITITSPDLNALTVSVDAGINNNFNLTDGGVTITKGYIASKSADLIGDLKYNAVYTPDYVEEGPLYTLKDAGFNVKSLVTGTMDLATSEINWESIDLTKKPSEWLDSQDYNLFSVDAVSGYWAYLEAATEATLAITSPNFKPTYKYHFNTDGTTFNSVSGNLAIEVIGFDEADTIDIKRTAATVNAYVAGTTLTLSRTGSSNVYTGKISSYTIPDMAEGSDYEIFANVADGLGSNLKSAPVGMSVDYTKPTAPVVTETSGLFSFTSTDAVSFYLFKDKISETDLINSDDYLATLDVATAASYALCSKLDAIDEFSATATKTDPYTLRVFSVDGTGALGGGNASDVTSKVYLPMLKSAVFLIDQNLDDSDPATYNTPGTVVYTDSCEVDTTNTKNYGITLTSESSNVVAKLAFNYVENRDITSTPLTVFIKNGDSAKVKITYPESYAGERVYVEVGDQVFAFKLRTAQELEDNGGESIDTALSLNPGDTSVSKLLTGIKF